MGLVDSIAVAQVRVATRTCAFILLSSQQCFKNLNLQAAGSSQLASLGPNTLIFGFATYIFSALSIATIRYEVGEPTPALEGASTALLHSIDKFCIAGLPVLDCRVEKSIYCQIV